MQNEIDFPEGFLDGNDVEGVLFSPVHDRVGVVATSSLERELLVLRLYEINKLEGNDTFQVIRELEAFSFMEREQLDEFMISLPKMSGIDMLLLLNQSSPSFLNE